MNARARLRSAVLSAAIRCARAVLRRPRLKRLAKSMLALMPSVRTRVRVAMYKATLASQVWQSNRIRDDADLSPRSVRMLRALDRAAEPDQAP